LTTRFSKERQNDGKFILIPRKESLLEKMFKVKVTALSRFTNLAEIIKLAQGFQVSRLKPGPKVRPWKMRKRSYDLLHWIPKWQA
jgi:hypothetical protein